MAEGHRSVYHLYAGFQLHYDPETDMVNILGWHISAPGEEPFLPHWDVPLSLPYDQGRPMFEKFIREMEQSLGVVQRTRELKADGMTAEAAWGQAQREQNIGER